MDKEGIIKVFDLLFSPAVTLVQEERVSDFLDYCALNNLVRIVRSFEDVSPNYFWEHRSLGDRFLNKRGIEHYVARAEEDEDFEKSHRRNFLPIV